MHICAVAVRPPDNALVKEAAEFLEVPLSLVLDHLHTGKHTPATATYKHRDRGAYGWLLYLDAHGTFPILAWGVLAAPVLN